MKSIFREISYRQKNALALKQGLVDRDITSQASAGLNADNRVLVITGMRRTGKSTLMMQLMHSLNNYCYFNFEDEKLLNFSVEQFVELEEVLIEVYGPSNYYFFDEIQNVTNFEVAVRRMQDERKKVVITGSNASLLSMEFGTKLTGRYKQINLYPFSFTEFLRMKQLTYEEKDFYLPESKTILQGYFTEWMENGGIPGYLINGDDEYVRTLFDNILYRDIIVRYGIRRHRQFRELVQLLASNLTTPVTFSSLQKSLGLSNSETVKEYMEYLSNAYLFYELRRYYPSLKRQLLNPRKIYLNDPAFHNLLGINISPNLGRKLENSVFLYLRSHSIQIYSYKGTGECDFIAFGRDNKPIAIQVCYNLNAENEEREYSGLYEAMEKFELEKGTLLTLEQEFVKIFRGRNIQVMPAWKWMLTNKDN